MCAAIFVLFHITLLVRSQSLLIIQWCCQRLFVTLSSPCRQKWLRFLRDVCFRYLTCFAWVITALTNYFQVSTLTRYFSTIHTYYNISQCSLIRVWINYSNSWNLRYYDNYFNQSLSHIHTQLNKTFWVFIRHLIYLHWTQKTFNG